MYFVTKAYSRIAEFVGRNGCFKSQAIEIAQGDNFVGLTPITTRNTAANCRIDIPVENAAEVGLALIEAGLKVSAPAEAEKITAMIDGVLQKDLYLIVHEHRHGLNLSYVRSEQAPTEQDLMDSDPDCYELDRDDESVDIANIATLTGETIVSKAA